jgi:hypothetical protein
MILSDRLGEVVCGSAVRTMVVVEEEREMVLTWGAAVMGDVGKYAAGGCLGRAIAIVLEVW